MRRQRHLPRPLFPIRIGLFTTAAVGRPPCVPPPTVPEVFTNSLKYLIHLLCCK